VSSYDAGEAFLRIVPSFQGFQTVVDRQMARAGTLAGRVFARAFNDEVRSQTNNAPLGPSTQQTTRGGEKTGRTFAESFKARVAAALRSLPDVSIDADSTPAQRRIAEIRLQLEALAHADIGVDIDAAEALAQIDRLKAELDELGAKSPDVQVRVDTARAIAQLEEIQAEIDRINGEKVDINADDHGSISATRAALLSLLPALIPVGAAFTAVFAGALGIIGAVTAAIGVLTLGLGGVGKTVDLLNQRQQLRDSPAAGQQASSNASAVSSARQQLADAERRVARQRVSDAESVARAERDLTDAENQLHLARVQAVRDLQDMANAQVDANLGERQAEIDVANAQAQLDQVNHDWTATAKQRQQAQLALDEAQQRLVEAKQKATRATEDNNKAQKAGVDGAPAVVDAVKRQRDAVLALRDARRKQRQDAADGAREIARAEQAVTQALQTQASAASGVGRQIDEINAKLAKTPPAVLAFAKFWRSQMSPVIADLKQSAASGLLPGLERGLRILRPLFPAFDQFIHRMGSVIGNLFTDMAKAFRGPFWTQFFAFLSRNLPKWLNQFGHTVGNVATGLAGLFRVFGPFITAIGRGLESITSKFASFGKGASQNSGVQKFLAYVAKEGPVVIDLVEKLLAIVVKLLQGLAPLGAVMLKVVDAIADFLAPLSPNELLAIAAAVGVLWAALGGPATAIAIAVTAAVALIVNNWGTIKKAFQAALDWIHDVFFDAWHAVDGYIVHPVESAIDGVRKAWDAVTGFFTGAWDWVRNTFADIWNGVTSVITGPIDAVKSFFSDAFGPNGPLRSALSGFISGVKTIWHGIEEIFGAPINWVIRYIFDDALIKAWNLFATLPGIPRIDPIPQIKFAAGGIYPGYTPGRDIGYVGVSGGEAIMRPEWTRAVGEDYVHAANAAARSGGVSGVHNFLGGFDGGGVVGGGLVDTSGGGGILGAVLGPVHSLLDKFGDNGWTRYLYDIPVGMAKMLWHVITAALKRLGYDALNTGTDIAGSILGGSVHLGGTIGGGVTGGPAANQKLARALMPRFGFSLADFASLLPLWTRESGWSEFADTRASGLDPADASVFAYGIPQARPATKLPPRGRPADLGGVSDPLSQILWGLDYIKGRYHTPMKAWEHELTFGWYDRGGALEPGYTLVYNGTGQAEIVAPRQTFDELVNGGGSREMHATGEMRLIADDGSSFTVWVDQRVKDRGDFDGAMGRTR
jgi:hypothetical protein